MNRKEKKIEAKMTYDHLIKLIQGKHIHLVSPGLRVVLKPPVTRMCMSPAEIRDIKRQIKNEHNNC